MTLFKVPIKILANCFNCFILFCSKRESQFNMPQSLNFFLRASTTSQYCVLIDVKTGLFLPIVLCPKTLQREKLLILARNRFLLEIILARIDKILI